MKSDIQAQKKQENLVNRNTGGMVYWDSRDGLQGEHRDSSVARFIGELVEPLVGCLFILLQQE